MRPVHEQFLDAIAEERTRLTTRRGFLVGGATVAGGGALALALSGVASPRGTRRVAAQEFTDDLDILNYALTLERLEFAFYRDGLEQFDEAAFAEFFGEETAAETPEADETPEGEVTAEATGIAGEAEPATIRQRFEDIRDNEEAHVDALVETVTGLGGTPVDEPSCDFGMAFEDLETFLTTAQALENTGVSAYLGAAPSITDPAILAAAASIATVEARHASYLNLINGDEPFPDAFDEALTREEVLAAVEEVGCDVTPDETPTAEAAAPTAPAPVETAAPPPGGTAPAGTEPAGTAPVGTPAT